MRKISPEAVRDDFRQQLQDLAAFHQTGFAAFTTDSDQSTQTERSLLAAAVSWEGFVSDMFIAYINRDATRFKQHLTQSFNDHLDTAAKPRRVFDSFGKLDFPRHLKKADVQALADNVGNNITFPNYAELERRAGAWLIPAHAAKFSGLTAQQKAVIDAGIALRNHIAHRSQRSLDAMNNTLAAGALYPTGIQRGPNRFHMVGAWLKARPVGSPSTRFDLVMHVLDSVAATF